MSRDVMEREANAFAMELLMPEKFLRADIKKLGGIDIESDKRIAKLAKRYRVSEQLMSFRLAQLAQASPMNDVNDSQTNQQQDAEK